MRKLIPAVIICSILASPLAFSENDAKSFDPYSTIWKDPQSKEWGDTPEFVKLLVTRISSVYSNGQSSADKNTVSPFSVIWLQQVLKEPEKYKLSSEDQSWIKTTLIRSAEKGSDEWRPYSEPVKEVAVAEEKAVVAPEPVAVVEQTVVALPEPVVSNAETLTPAVSKDVNVVKEDAKKEIIETSKPKEEKAIVVAEKKSVEKSVIEVKQSKTEKPAVAVEVKKDIEKPKIEEGNTIIVTKSTEVVPVAIQNNVFTNMLKEKPWMQKVIEQLLLIVLFGSVLMSFIGKSVNKITRRKA